jgi:hypothetical protein
VRETFNVHTSLVSNLFHSGRKAIMSFTLSLKHSNSTSLWDHFSGSCPLFHLKQADIQKDYSSFPYKYMKTKIGTLYKRPMIALGGVMAYRTMTFTRTDTISICLQLGEGLYTVKNSIKMSCLRPCSAAVCTVKDNSARIQQLLSLFKNALH